MRESALIVCGTCRNCNNGARVTSRKTSSSNVRDVCIDWRKTMTHKPRRWPFSAYQKRIIALPLDGMGCAYSVNSFAKFSVCYGTTAICRAVAYRPPMPTLLCIAIQKCSLFWRNIAPKFLKKMKYGRRKLKLISLPREGR